MSQRTLTSCQTVSSPLKCVMVCSSGLAMKHSQRVSLATDLVEAHALVISTKYYCQHLPCSELLYCSLEFSVRVWLSFAIQHL